MLEVNEVEVERAIALLRDNGFGDLAGHIEQLRTAYHERGLKKPWLWMDNLERLARMIYPANSELSDELKERHYRHICIALQLQPEVLNEDVKELFKRVENVKK